MLNWLQACAITDSGYLEKRVIEINRKKIIEYKLQIASFVGSWENQLIHAVLLE